MLLTITYYQKNKAKQSSDAKRASYGEDSSEADHEEEDENEASSSYENIEGAYNPAQYDNLGVSSEVKDLFQYISRFKPHEVDLMTTLKCFIPEYIPSIGEIDAFIKVRFIYFYLYFLCHRVII